MPPTFVRVKEQKDRIGYDVILTGKERDDIRSVLLKIDRDLQDTK